MKKRRRQSSGAAHHAKMEAKATRRKNRPAPIQTSSPSSGLAVAQRPAGSTRPLLTRLPSVALLADNPAGIAEDYAAAVLDHVDGMSNLRNGLHRIAMERGHWAGIPLLMRDCPLTIEPTYPRAAELMAASQGTAVAPKDDEDEARAADGLPAGYTVRSRFWSTRDRCWAVTATRPDGKVECYLDIQPQTNADMLLQTLFASDAWGINQERRAIDTLGTLLPHRHFKQYLMTGMFLETSKRSGVRYLFRRLRPTLAISTAGEQMKILRAPGTKVLAALCLHPIGYYDGSWAGAMCPTDDVIAHLMLMRGDEAMFWRRANQHPAWSRLAGIVA